MMIKEQLPLKIEGIDGYLAKLISNSPSWLKDFRQRAWGEFTELGLPTVKEEEWKYSSLIDLSSKTHQIASHHKLSEEKQFNAYLDSADMNIVLVNGVLWGDLSTKRHIKGLTVKSFSDAAVHCAGEFKDTLIKLTSNDPKSLLYLNHALFLDGVFIKVEDNAVVEPLVHIIHLTSNIEQDTIVFPRSVIRVGVGAKVSILESHIGFTPNSYWSNALTDMYIAENAYVEYCKAEGEASHAVHTAISYLAGTFQPTRSFLVCA